MAAPAASTSTSTSTDHRPGAVFWITAAIGAAVVVFGVRGLFENEPRGAASAVRWYIGGALVLDLIVVPLGAVAGAVAKRVVPAWTWPAVRAGLLASVTLIAVAAPLIIEPQGPSSNASVRPRDYEQGLALALAATWVVVAGWLAIARRRGAAARPSPEDGSSTTT